MKKAIREWAFNLFAKRITIKVAKLPDDAKIEFLVNKLMNELVAQGYGIKGIDSDCDYLTLYGSSLTKTVEISSNSSPSLFCKRLTKV